MRQNLPHVIALLPFLPQKAVLFPRDIQKLKIHKAIAAWKQLSFQMLVIRLVPSDISTTLIMCLYPPQKGQFLCSILLRSLHQQPLALGICNRIFHNTTHIICNTNNPGYFCDCPSDQKPFPYPKMTVL
uniref:Uncharacterized protein n=1 Tax=Micrurus spixii TaxID=129469 RepID=A0A2D4MBE3_9SAUR